MNNTNLEVFTITEVARTIHSGEQEITIEYCTSLLQQSETLIGYSLHLAQEYIFMDDAEGFEAYCKEHHYSLERAYRHIRFFKAKSLFAEKHLLPNGISAFDVLPGANAGQKIKSYARVKQLLNEVDPSYDDIKFVSKVLKRGITDENLVIEFVDIMKKQKTSVKKAFSSRAKQIGLRTFITAVSNGYSEADLIKVCMEGRRTTPKAEIKIKSRQQWEKLTKTQQYARVMFLESKLEELTGQKVED